MERKRLHEQLAYYRAYAPEYGQVDVRIDGWLAVARRKLLELGHVSRILELAPGTGDWTGELVELGDTVTAVDGSPEMIAINKRRVANPRVNYQQADLFEWEPHDEYDLVFFAFWLSHVPPDLVDAFLLKVRNAVRPGGHLFVVDQANDPPGYPPPKREGIFEERMLVDGRTFTIVKILYHPALLAERVRQLGFEATAERVDLIFYLIGTRSAP